MKTKVYVTGPVANRSVDQLNEFSLVAEKLEEANYEVHTPLTVISRADERSMSREEIIVKRVRKMFECSTVIPLDDYEQDVDSIAEVKIARLVDKTVCPVTRFLNEHCKQLVKA